MTLRRLSARAFIVVSTLTVWLALHPAPFTMHVLDEAGRAAAGVRIITDNGIVCFTLLDGTASWTELSLLRRAVRFEVRDDHHRYADASARLQFDFVSGGYGAPCTTRSHSRQARCDVTWRLRGVTNPTKLARCA